MDFLKFYYLVSIIYKKFKVNINKQMNSMEKSTEMVNNSFEKRVIKEIGLKVKDFHCQI